MKALFTAALAAALTAGAAAHSHQHLHQAAKRHSNQLDRRGPAFEPHGVINAPDAYEDNTAPTPHSSVNAPNPQVTRWMLGNKSISPEEAKKCIEDGLCYIPPDATTAPAAPAPSIQFNQEPAVPPPAVSSPAPDTSQYAPPQNDPPSPPPQPAAVSQATAYATSATGLHSIFPDGKLKCSELPTAYGAVALTHLDFNGWAGLQILPPGVSFKVDQIEPIATFATGVKGDNCSPNQFCSYACPPGYQKTQWPKSQGKTGQSIGGLFCNAEGRLELTRPSVTTLCEAGAGGLSVVSKLDQVVSICRTDYPGTEGMYLPYVAQPGNTTLLMNPKQKTSYIWKDQPTSAQYYVNNKGKGPEDACIWGLKEVPKGNYAPLVFGASLAKDNLSYISIKKNPDATNMENANFNVQLKAGGMTCTYEQGTFSGQGLTENTDGCTLAFAPGSKGEYILYD